MAGKYSSKNQGKKRRPMTFKRFMRRYFSWIIAALLLLFCIYMGVLLVRSFTGNEQTEPSDTQGTGQTEPGSTEQTDPDGTEETEPTDDQAALEQTLQQAKALADGYDYQGAIELLKAVDGYEAQSRITSAIAEYEKLDGELVSQTQTQLQNVPHIFFHSLIVDPERAFDGDVDQDGYNLYMCTISEFEAIMQQMYDKGYVLVTPYDIAYEVTDETGTHMVYGDIRLPEGKKPFLLSQDDVNYYSYMISSGNGKNETPYWADTAGDGFASRIVIGEDGYPTCEYMDADGNVTVGDYDLVPVLEKFIQAHPDFSYHGARAILGVTGYEGVFGYRTKPSYETAMGTAAYQQEVEQAKAVAQCLKDHGWIIASHSYGHPRYGDLTAERVDIDSTKWEDTVQPIVGETDILIYPHGSDINSWRPYTFENEKYKILYEDGYRYFFNVDSTIGWTQITDTSFRGGRVNIDGYRMWNAKELLSVFFDVDAVFDPKRPTPVPPLSGSM